MKSFKKKKRYVHGCYTCFFFFLNIVIKVRCYWEATLYFPILPVSSLQFSQHF